MSDGGEWVGIAGVAILLGYYALASFWLARRRHVPEPPRPEAILSPAEIRFLHRREFDGRTLLVAILDLVARGALSLKSRPNGTAYLERSLDAVDDADLADDTVLVRNALFRAGNRMVDLTDAREDALLHTGIALRHWLERRYLAGANLSRGAWTWLLLAGGAIAAGAIVATASGAGGYGAEMAALVVIFYVFALISVGSTILFLQQFRAVIFTLKLVIVFTLIPALPVLLVLVAGSLIDFYKTHGPIGMAPFVLPLIGSALLISIGRSRFEVEPSAVRQMDDWYRRVAAGPAPRDGAADGVNGRAPIDPIAIVALALDAGDAAFGRLGAVFDDLAVPSGRVSLFGARRGRVADLGSIGSIATR